MELQIKQERERILAEEKAKERQIRTELEQQLYEKEKQLQEILNRHQEMEQKLSQINNTEAKTKLENEKLQKEKEELEEMLSRSQDNLEESRTYIQQMQLQQKDEKRERARSCEDILEGGIKNKNLSVTFHHDIQRVKPRLSKGRRAALMLSEGIAIERESLVKQLDLLKDVNKRLRDDKDEAEATDPRLSRSRAQNYRPQNLSPGRSFVSRGQLLVNTSQADRKGQLSWSQLT